MVKIGRPLKHKPPSNRFSEATRALFMFNFSCFLCGSNQNVEADHIVGRSSNSPFNLSPICRTCHLGKGRKDWGRQLVLTAGFLMRQEYKITKKDLDFLNKYKDYYKKNGMGYWWKKTK